MPFPAAETGGILRAFCGWFCRYPVLKVGTVLWEKEKIAATPGCDFLFFGLFLMVGLLLVVVNSSKRLVGECMNGGVKQKVDDHAND